MPSAAPALGAGLAGKGVIVTGGAGAIGREVASAFAAAGARVLVTDLRRSAVERAVRALPGTGHHGIACDLRDLSAHAGLLDQARRRLGSVRALVHLAAVLRRRAEIGQVTERDWDLQLTTNLKAGFFLCRADRRDDDRPPRARADRAVFVAGVVDRGIRRVGRVQRRKGRRRHDDAGACADVRRAWDHGQLRRARPRRHPDADEGPASAVLRSLVSRCRLAGSPRPAEIAGATVFLASDHASYITGATINVSGGFLMY